MRKKVVIGRKVDMDTCLTALILGISWEDEIVVREGGALEEEIADSGVICIEAGGSGDIERMNFDHHNTLLSLPSACMQAFEFKGRPEKFRKVVEYVNNVDTGKKFVNKPDFPTLSSIFSGMLYTVKGQIAQFKEGLKLLKMVVEKNIDPFGKMPDLSKWRKYVEAKKKTMEYLEQDLKNTEKFYTEKGLRAGYVETLYFGALGVLYRKGYDVVIIFNREYGCPPVPKYTIGGREDNGFVVLVSSLLDELNKLEPGWGGPSKGTIIGSPYRGTILPPDKVKEVVKKGDIRIVRVRS